MNRLIKQIWNSSTWMTWAGYLVMPLRLLLVTPLMLTRFSETDLAAWYLFASVNFFGSIVAQRFSITFSRMFAFAMGGAADLSPVTKRVSATQSKQEPNWDGFARAYGTLGLVSLAGAAVNLVVSGAIGWASLHRVISGRSDLWAAFAIFIASDLICFVYRRYSIALIGMNYVAMEARWTLVFNVFSVLVGALVLGCGGKVLALTVAMQAITLLGPLRQRFLLGLVEAGRVLTFAAYKFDRVAFGWAWPPTYKGFLGEMSLIGSTQITSLVYANQVRSGELASYLFSMRILDVIVNMGQVPYTAIQPGLSRMLASGQVTDMVGTLKHRFKTTWLLTAGGLLAAGLILPPLLLRIGSQTRFMETQVWIVFGFVTLLSRFLVLNTSVCALGNDFPFYRELLGAAVLAALAVVWLDGRAGAFGPFLSGALPALLLVNVRGIKKAAAALGEPWQRLFIPDFAVIWLVYALAGTALIALSR